MEGNRREWEESSMERLEKPLRKWTVLQRFWEFRGSAERIQAKESEQGASSKYEHV
jgi:hypothetical protein